MQILSIMALSSFLHFFFEKEVESFFESESFKYRRLKKLLLSSLVLGTFLKIVRNYSAVLIWHLLGICRERSFLTRRRKWKFEFIARGIFTSSEYSSKEYLPESGTGTLATENTPTCRKTIWSAACFVEVLCSVLKTTSYAMTTLTLC